MINIDGAMNLQSDEHLEEDPHFILLCSFGTGSKQCNLVYQINYVGIYKTRLVISIKGYLGQLSDLSLN